MPHILAIPLPLDGIPAQNLRNLLHLFVTQRHERRVLDDALPPRRAGDGDDLAQPDRLPARPNRDLATAEAAHPGDRDLRHGAFLACSEQGDLVGDPVVVREDVVLELREALLGIAGGDVGVAANRGRRQHAAAQRAVGDDGDAEVGARRGDAVAQDVGRPQAELDFDGGDGVDGRGAADRGGFHFREADGADLAFGDAGGEGGHGRFHGGVGVDASALEDVDWELAVEEAQTLVDGASDVRL